MLEKMRLALRVTSHAFDDEITAFVEAARKELVRSGVKREKAYSEDDELITMAVRAYVLASYYPDDSERYWQSFACQMDNLRKSSGYMGEAAS